MTKEELIQKVADDAQITKAAATKAVNCVFSSISGALAKGEEISVVGFGKFSVSERAERTGRNPQTGAELKIAAKKAPKFTAGKGLRDAVAEG